MNTDIQRNLLIVKSKDRVSGSSSNFQYSLGDATLDIRSITLKSACIPHTHTNVSENNNDLIVEIGAEFTLTATAQANYYINGINSSIPVSSGIYTLNTLISTLNANQTFGEFSYNSGINRVTFTITDAGVNLNGVDFTTGGIPEIIGLLGFTLPVNCPTGVGSSITATNAPTYVENNVFNLTITPNQYTATTLLTEVMNELNLIFTSAGTGVINADGKIEINAPTDTWKFRKSGVAELLGYYPPDMIFTNNQIAQGVPDLYGTRNLYVSSRVLANGYNSLDANGVKSSILGDIPVCSSYSGIDKYQADYPIKKDYPNNINICNFDIKILDDYEKVVDLKGCNIVLVFEVYANTKL